MERSVYMLWRSLPVACCLKRLFGLIKLAGLLVWAMLCYSQDLITYGGKTSCCLPKKESAIVRRASCFIWYLEETPLLVGATLSVASVEFYSIVYMLLLPFTSCGRSFGLKC
ncbi:Hypothetical predicted protein [Olea europaea subsp. europaea]|uniref:Uncharacterized protein n=1 Tax=Olea europaea subsp. europaea TaxID=158383 RepID=A0A8S0TVJ6_OLEEU|nr:Hypothetical predicted protein [Olea europaea subsp. europaea]